LLISPRLCKFIADNIALQKDYEVEVSNRFDALMSEQPEDDLQSTYDNFVQTIEESSSKLVKKSKKKCKP
jgi:hypothetical protein